MNNETALTPMSGDQPFDRRYLEMAHLYDGAIRSVRTKLEILDREFSIHGASNPIHHIDSRLKSPQSIVEKLHRKGFPVTIESAEEHLFDIAGVKMCIRDSHQPDHAANVPLEKAALQRFFKREFLFRIRLVEIIVVAVEKNVVRIERCV